MHAIKRTFLFLALILSAWTTAVQADTLTFGVVPQQSAKTLARLWAPLLKHISEESGHTIRFSTAPNIPEFERRLSEGEYDFAYMNPYHFTVFNQAPGYRAVARAKDKRIKGIVVVQKDSPVQSIEELNGATLAFPAPAAFAATVLPQASFRAKNIDFTPKYVSSHDSVYRTVAKGLFPAGGGVVRTFGNVAPEVRDQLRILWTTEGFTPHAVAIHPRHSKELLESVRAVLVGLDQDADGMKLVKRINLKGFVAARNEDWDDVRRLNITLLKDLIAQH